jgi:hypothetical protein
MRRPNRSFAGEAMFALIASVSAAAFASTLGLLFPGEVVFRIVATGLSLAYLLRTIFGPKDASGRAVVIAIWGVGALAAWFFAPSLPIYVALHLAMLWLARSAVLHSNLSEAGMDLCLTAAAISFGVWAAFRTESLFVSIWCCLLVQAFGVLIPAASRRLFRNAWQRDAPGAWYGRSSPGESASRRAPARSQSCNRRGFSEARAAADDALQQIATRHRWNR